MDYRVVSLLAMMVASCLCAPDPKAKSWASKCPCAKIYVPLCASDGNTYNNMCEFKCHADYFKEYFRQELFVLKDDLCEDLFALI